MVGIYDEYFMIYRKKEMWPGGEKMIFSNSKETE